MTTVAHDHSFVRGQEEPMRAPPQRDSGVVRWMKANLFSSLGNTVLTFLGVVFILWALPPIIRWAFFDAVWVAADREPCAAPGAGACWAFVKAKFGQFMYGRYPIEERWRVDVTGILLVAGVVLVAVPQLPAKRPSMVYLFGVFPLIGVILLTGGNFDISPIAVGMVIVAGCALTGGLAMVVARREAPILAGRVAPGAALVSLAGVLAAFFAGPLPVLSIAIAVCAAIAFTAGTAGVLGASRGRRRLWSTWIATAVVGTVLVALSVDFRLQPVGTDLWGGLLVTLVVAIVGMAASMPLGIVLALGRRSDLPVIRFVSIVFIEFVRGVPLITVLFMASVMLPFFLPPGVNFDKLLRALIGVALFSAAYMAEVVRGGLQAIPRGQYEAADALGLSYWRKMRLVVLPQALKIVIPGIVNSFISLFKDTSLVFIIGIFDLLGAVSQNFTDANWASRNTPATGFVFAAAVFWVFCFGMSRYSIFMERRLNTGYRR